MRVVGDRVMGSGVNRFCLNPWLSLIGFTFNKFTCLNLRVEDTNEIRPACQPVLVLSKIQFLALMNNIKETLSKTM